jgi:BirA family transcriptional regulator, biotin operon repressor / biotin---[acetyl-CoA-carboxylase] ligase
MATLFIGQNKVYLPETDSTNSYAIGLLKNVKVPEGTAVFTDKQTAGRGQRGKSWSTDPSMNITLSLIVKPQFLDAKKSFFLSKIAALSVYDVLTDILNTGQFDIRIKWPNDILVNGKKIAGILIENSFKEETFIWSVIGIGLNVNQEKFEALSSAVSLSSLCGNKLGREGVMQLLFEKFEKWYLLLRSGKHDKIDEAYFKNLFRLNEESWFIHENKQFKAKMVGVKDNGLLELRLEDNSTRSFDVKDVQFVL